MRAARSNPNSWLTTRNRNSLLRTLKTNPLRRSLRPQGANLHPSRPLHQPLLRQSLLRPPPSPPKEGPVALDNEVVKRYKERFGDAIREAWIDRKQAILVVAREQLVEIAIYSRDDEKFDWLSDLTAVDWPKREKRFDIVLNMYSFEKNERLRLKVYAAAEERVPSVQGVWATANWLEREVYDMFGVVFEGHPELKRILMPDEWQGHPLRKDYDILTQDTAWVRENLGIESGQ